MTSAGVLDRQRRNAHFLRRLIGARTSPPCRFCPSMPVLTAYHQLQPEALSKAASVAMIEQLRKGTP